MEMQAVKADIRRIENEKAGLEAEAAAIKKKKPDTYDENAAWLSFRQDITAKETNLGELRKKENNLQSKIDALTQVAMAVEQGIFLCWLQ